MEWSMIHGMNDLTRLITGRRLLRDTLRREAFWAVQDVSMRLHRGEIVSVLGKWFRKTTLNENDLRNYSGRPGKNRGSWKRFQLFALKTGMQPHLPDVKIFMWKPACSECLEKAGEKIDWIIVFLNWENLLMHLMEATHPTCSLVWVIPLQPANRIRYFNNWAGLSVGVCFVSCKVLHNLKVKARIAIIFITHNLRLRIEIAWRIIC